MMRDPRDIIERLRRREAWAQAYVSLRAELKREPTLAEWIERKRQR